MHNNPEHIDTIRQKMKRFLIDFTFNWSTWTDKSKDINKICHFSQTWSHAHEQKFRYIMKRYTWNSIFNTSNLYKWFCIRRLAKKIDIF